MLGDIYKLCDFCKWQKEKICYCKINKKAEHQKPKITEKLRTSRRKATKKYCTNPENKLKYIARYKTNVLIRSGKLKRDVCKECGCTLFEY